MADTMTPCECGHDRQSHEVSENFNHPCHLCDCEDFERAQDGDLFAHPPKWWPENVDVKGGLL